MNKEIIDEQKTCPECGNEKLEEKKSIEVGNIFKLKTKYSAAFDYKYTDEKGEKQIVTMGCYGIGPSRVLGTIVEVHHDDGGIIWPESVAPFQIHLISLCKDAKDIKQADEIYSALTKSGKEVLYNDRADTTAGAKFADSDLIGIPTRIIVSPKTLAKMSVEVKKRNETESKSLEIKSLEHAEIAFL